MANQDLPTPVKFAKYDDGDEYNRQLRAGAPDVYNYTAYPALLVFKDGKHEKYLGGRESHELVDYMTAVAKGLDPIEEEKKSKPGLYKREVDFDPLLMAELDVDNFDAEVLENDNVVWIIEFYSDHCPICKSLAPEIIKAAKEVCACHGARPRLRCLYRACCVLWPLRRIVPAGERWGMNDLCRGITS